MGNITHVSDPSREDGLETHDKIQPKTRHVR